MLTPVELHDKLVLCLVKPPPIDVRPRLAALLRGNNRVELRYEWVKEWSWLMKLVELSGWELGDGQEWVTLWRE